MFSKEGALSHFDTSHVVTRQQMVWTNWQVHDISEKSESFIKSISMHTSLALNYDLSIWKQVLWTLSRKLFWWDDNYQIQQAAVVRNCASLLK